MYGNERLKGDIMAESSLITVTKKRVITEDIDFGVGSTQQERGGVIQVYERVNASKIPTTTPGESIQDKFDSLGDGGYTKAESEGRFARKNGESSEQFVAARATSNDQVVNLQQLIDSVDEIPSSDESQGPSDEGLLTKLDVAGKLSTTFHNVASKDDIVGGSGQVILSGQEHRDALLEMALANSTDEYDPLLPAESAMKLTYTKPDGKLDLSLLGIDITLSMQGPWTPTAGDEYPDVTGIDPGAIFIITELGVGNDYTFTGGDLTGQTTVDNDFLVYGEQAWVLMHEVAGSQVFYAVDGTIPLSAPLNSGGQGTVNQGDLNAAPTDATSGTNPEI